DALLDAWLYEVLPGREVLIVTYGCRYDGGGDVRMSDEHNAVGLFDIAEIDGLPMPEGYRRSIRDWHRRQGASERSIRRPRPGCPCADGESPPPPPRPDRCRTSGGARQRAPRSAYPWRGRRG